MKALSPPDALFLMLEGRRQPMHVAGLQLFSKPKDAPDNFMRKLVRHAMSFEQPKAPFNQQLKFRLGRWYWVEDEHFELEHHVRHYALPEPGRIRELLALVSQLHATPLDRARPLWEFAFIEGLNDGRIAVYSKVHHALFDGVAAVRMGRESLNEDPNLLDSPPMWAREPIKHGSRKPPAPAEANRLLAMAEGLRANAGILPAAYTGFRDIFRKSHGPEDVTPFQAPPTLLNGPISSSRRFAAQSYPLARIRAVGKATGSTINDVVLGMCAGALREYLISQNALPNDPLIAMVPVSVRSEETADAGNQVAVMLANLATHIGDPGKRLETIVASSKHAKQRLSKMTRQERMAYGAASLSPMSLATLFGYDKVHPAFNVVISNVPGPKAPLYMNGARLDEMYPLSIPIDGQAMNITLTSYLDDIAFGFTACRRTLPSMQRLLDYTEQALHDLENACGLLEPVAEA